MFGCHDDRVRPVDRIDACRENPDRRFGIWDLGFGIFLRSAIRKLPSCRRSGWWEQFEIYVRAFRPADPVALPFDDVRRPVRFDLVETIEKLLSVRGRL